MSLAIVHSRAPIGLSAPAVRVEVHLANGLPGMTLVGLPETAVKESRDRVRSALQNAGFEFPARRITVNLSPADLPKEGGRYDLPIALGILAASGQIPVEPLAQYECLGELALNGELRPVRGVLPAALACGEQQRALLIPETNSAEAALVEGVTVYAVPHLLALTAHLQGMAPLTPTDGCLHSPLTTSTETDLRDIRGQGAAKRALEVAAAGGHNLLLHGPPGTGKTLLASRLPGLLPAMSRQAALEVAAIRSIRQGFDIRDWGQRPFRTPHHTSSAVALVGGGSHPRPGEISLAHHGVLFLDELPEFERKVLEVLREPLESGQIHISRAAQEATFPAHFLLVAAMNPCPCGHLGDPRQPCVCSAQQVQRYRARLSGPLLDRIDLHVEVPALPPEALWAPPEGDDSPTVRARVAATHERQYQRAGCLNGALTHPQLRTHAALSDELQQLISQAMQRMHLSARAVHRMIKVARTLADLDASEAISRAHVLEALSYRGSLDAAAV